MSLNTNQIKHRVNLCINAIEFQTRGLDTDVKNVIIEGVASHYQAVIREAENSRTADAIPEKILNAIHQGLEGANPQMVRAAMDYQSEHAGREYLKELTVHITPYAIPDDSFEKIIAEADDHVIAQIEAALAKRRAS